MIVTPTEAKQLWCPFARAERGQAAVSRSTNGAMHSACRCLADGCMAWVWYNDPGDPAQRRGFCGLVRRRQYRT